MSWGTRSGVIVADTGAMLALVDAIVAATAERLRARAIATLDLRDFSPLRLSGNPQLYPRDLPRAG